MVAPFENAAFALEEPGDRSDWFRTQFGYHIIQLDEIGVLPTYDQSYDELKSLAQRLPRFEAAERAYGEQVRKELSTSIDTTALEQLLSPFPSDSVLYFLALEQWTEEQAATTIATMGGRAFTLDDFLEYGMSRQAERPGDYSMDAVYDLINDLFDARAIDVAAGNLEDTDPEYADLMREYSDGIILFRVMEDSVWNRATQDSAAIEALFLANTGKYQFPERSRVISYFASDDSLLTVLAEAWQPGDTTDWSRQFSEDTRYRMDTMYVADSTRSVYDRTIGLSPGESVGPIPYRNGRIVLLVDGIEAPRAKTLQEARAEVLGEYQEIVEDQWLARLREKYDARTYPGHLEAVFMADADSSEPVEAPTE
jgi:peptidyl-prolyl cis-trans isomerase SurA